MTQTLSIRIDAETKKSLDALSKRFKRSKSFLAAEAITAYVESEEWQLDQLQSESPNWTQDKKSVMKEYRNGSTHGVNRVKQKYRDEGCLLPRAIRE